MKNNRLTLRAMLPALMIGAGVFSSCEPDNPNGDKPDVGDFSRYVIATSTTASNNTSYALLTASSIEEKDAGSSDGEAHCAAMGEVDAAEDHGCDHLITDLELHGRLHSRRKRGIDRSREASFLQTDELRPDSHYDIGDIRGQGSVAIERKVMAQHPQ